MRCTAFTPDDDEVQPQPGPSQLAGVSLVFQEVKSMISCFVGSLLFSSF